MATTTKKAKPSEPVAPIDLDDGTFTVEAGVLVKFKGSGRCGELEIPAGVTKIADEAFKGAEYGKIVIPEGVTEIGKCAFWWNPNLRLIKLPKTVRKFGEGVFSCSDHLASLTIPEGVEEIPGSFCEGCEKLKTVKIPKSVVKICERAFDSCNALKSVEVPKNAEVAEDAFPKDCEIIRK